MEFPSWHQGSYSDVQRQARRMMRCVSWQNVVEKAKKQSLRAATMSDSVAFGSQQEKQHCAVKRRLVERPTPTPTPVHLHSRWPG